MKSCLQNMIWKQTYSANNEGKSAVAEGLIKMLKSKIYKCMTSTSKIMYIN